jgi:hypothetical protein
LRVVPPDCVMVPVPPAVILIAVSVVVESVALMLLSRTTFPLVEPTVTLLPFKAPVALSVNAVVEVAIMVPVALVVPERTRVPLELYTTSLPEDTTPLLERLMLPPLSVVRITPAAGLAPLAFSVPLTLSVPPSAAKVITLPASTPAPSVREVPAEASTLPLLALTLASVIEPPLLATRFALFARVMVEPVC